MLDDAGHVASCNATNFFFVRAGEVFTSAPTSCFNGITRAKIIDLCHEAGIPMHQGAFGLLDVVNADEAFVTGSFGGVTPVRAVDFRPFPGPLPAPMTHRITNLYRDLIDRIPAWRPRDQGSLPPAINCGILRVPPRERRQAMATGTVKWFNPDKGFGFITPQDGGKDVFVHITAVQAAGLRSVNEGQKVTYEVISERGKLAASDLKLA